MNFASALFGSTPPHEEAADLSKLVAAARQIRECSPCALGKLLALETALTAMRERARCNVRAGLPNRATVAAAEAESRRLFILVSEKLEG